MYDSPFWVFPMPPSRSFHTFCCFESLSLILFEGWSVLLQVTLCFPWWIDRDEIGRGRDVTKEIETEKWTRPQFVSKSILDASIYIIWCRIESVRSWVAKARSTHKNKIVAMHSHVWRFPVVKGTWDRNIRQTCTSTSSTRTLDARRVYYSTRSTQYTPSPVCFKLE